MPIDANIQLMMKIRMYIIGNIRPIAKFKIAPGRRCDNVSRQNLKLKPAPTGFRWVFTRYRRVRNSSRILDAHEYGYEAWAFLVRAF